VRLAPPGAPFAAPRAPFDAPWAPFDAPRGPRNPVPFDNVAVGRRAFTRCAFCS